MSQQLVSATGGVQTLVTAPNINRLNVLSEQFIKVNKLEKRPTEWVPDGRPIYKRLPSVSQTYQINFEEDNSQGYVYIPWGEGLYGPASLEVVSSDSKEDLIIKSGNLVWAYGTNPVPPTLINLNELEIGSGRYLVVESSTDEITGWRYPVVNSFLDSTTKIWSNYDSYFPEFAQPLESFIQWRSNLTIDGVLWTSNFLRVVLRCPPNTAFSGTATLSLVNGSDSSLLQQVSISRDSAGQYFDFQIPQSIDDNGNAWRVDFSDLKMSVQSIRVTGNIPKVAPPSGPSTQSALTIYPENAVPTTYINSAGVQVPMAYCPLAFIDVGRDYTLQGIEDVRKIVHRDYTPVANWLTVPFDENLINLYEQVSGYSELWMNPDKCMKQEYAALTQYDVTLT